MVCALVRNGQTAGIRNYCLPQQDLTWEAKQLSTQLTERPEIKNIVSDTAQSLIQHSAGWLFAVFIFKPNKNNKKIREENQNLKNPERKKELKTRNNNITCYILSCIWDGCYLKMNCYI